MKKPKEWLWVLGLLGMDLLLVAVCYWGWIEYHRAMHDLTVVLGR